jgi:hypothetical protein
MKDRWFTPASARRTLAHIRPTVERLYRIYQELEFRRPTEIASDERVEPLYFRLLDRLVRGLDRLTDQGVHVGDLRQGLLDFPSQRDGRPVMLCWRVGESGLDFWHELEDGADRRRVDENGPWDPVD